MSVSPEYLRALLATTDTTQVELATAMGVTPLTVNRWLHGRLGISTSRWVHACAVLGVPSDWTPPQETQVIRSDSAT